MACLRRLGHFTPFPLAALTGVRSIFRESSMAALILSGEDVRNIFLTARFRLEAGPAIRRASRHKIILIGGG
jgi:hypothetical protein